MATIPLATSRIFVFKSLVDRNARPGTRLDTARELLLVLVGLHPEIVFAQRQFQRCRTPLERRISSVRRTNPTVGLSLREIHSKRGQTARLSPLSVRLSKDVSDHRLKKSESKDLFSSRSNIKDEEGKTAHQPSSWHPSLFFNLVES